MLVAGLTGGAGLGLGREVRGYPHCGEGATSSVTWSDTWVQPD